MDITREIFDAENSLKDFLDIVMSRQHGAEWIFNLKPVLKKVDAWEITRIPEELSHNAIKGKEKSIHYSSIQDLRDICTQYWNAELQSAFGDQQVFDSYLKIIQEFRNPNARRRELFVHQKHLLLGIAGDIRSKIALARNLSDSNAEGFPVIESVRDNQGNLWTAGSPRRVKAISSVKVGTELEFIVTAVDPLGDDLLYRVHGLKWQANNVIIAKLATNSISRATLFHLTIKSPRKYHANRMGFDDKVTFEYEVLP